MTHDEFSRKSFEIDKVNVDLQNSWNRPRPEKLTATPLSSRNSRDFLRSRRSTTPSSSRRSTSPFSHTRSRSPSILRRSRSPLLLGRSRSPLMYRKSASPGSIAHNNKSIRDENAMRDAVVQNVVNTVALDDNDDDEDDVEKEQLYISEGIDNMKHISNGIYCKKADYKNAVKETPSATAVARNLLVGVFKKETLVQGSVTGRSPRAQGLERMKQENVRLHDKATKTIIKFAQDYAKKRNWSTDASESKIKSAMAQKIVELKGENTKNSSISVVENP